MIHQPVGGDNQNPSVSRLSPVLVLIGATLPELKRQIKPRRKMAAA
jgi:hypothetical protein